MILNLLDRSNRFEARKLKHITINTTLISIHRAPSEHNNKKKGHLHVENRCHGS